MVKKKNFPIKTFDMVKNKIQGFGQMIFPQSQIEEGGNYFIFAERFVGKFVLLLDMRKMSNDKERWKPIP